LTVNNTLSRKVSLASGVRQGDPLSPTLFLLCIHPLLQALEQKGLETQAHADDTTVLCRGTKDIPRAVKILEQFETATGSRINQNKCVLLKKTQQGHCPFPTKHKERYLGINLHSNGTLTLLPHTLDNVLDRLTWWKQKHLSLKEKVTVLRAYIRPTLLYQAPYVDMEEHSKWVDQVERWFLSSCKGDFDPGRNYKRGISDRRAEHPLAMFGLLHINKDIERRQAGIYIGWKDTPLGQLTTPPKSPLRRIQQAAINISNKYRVALTDRSSISIRIKSALREQPMILTDRQQSWKRQHGIEWDTFMVDMYKWPVRPAVTSFIWKLINGTLPLAAHFRGQQACSICGLEENTNHVFGAKQDCIVTEDILTTFLAARTRNAQIEAAIELWAVWKTCCWAKHHKGKLDRIEINKRMETIQNNKLEEYQVAFG